MTSCWSEARVALLLTLLLCIPAPARCASPESLAVCPQWLVEYKDFHSRAKGATGSTYIIFNCGKGVRCKGGIGDRVKSILFLLRLAALYNKVLLVRWDHPRHAAVQRFLEPHAIDWTLAGVDEASLLKEQAGADRWNVDHPEAKFIPGLKELLHTAKPAVVEEFKAFPVLRTKMWVLDPATDRLPGAQDAAWIEAHGSLSYLRCLMSFMFKPSELLVRETQAALQPVFGVQAHPYLAWHWRTGGLVAEPKLPEHRSSTTTHELGSSRLRQIMSMTYCADTLADSRGLPLPSRQRPLLLVTDHNLIRQFVAAGQLAKLATLNRTAAHISTTNTYHISEEHAITNFVDLYLLAQADCLLTSNSGYSLVALWMSNTTCHRTMHECLLDDAHRFLGLEVRRRA